MWKEKISISGTSSPNSDPTDNLVDVIGRLSVNEEQTEIVDLTPEETVENDKEAADQETSKPTENSSVKEASSIPTTCWFFKQNICKFGMSGKGCKFSHPKICQKLLSHGTKSPKGCQKDGKCRFFHPVMCRNSLRKRLCTNQSCEFMHIRGTKRSESINATDARKTLDRLRNTRKSEVRDNSPRMESEKAEKQAADTFLEKGPNPKPQAQEAGNGYGGDQTMKMMMELLQKMVIMQTQQLQLLQHPQMHQVSPQMTLQTQLPVIPQHRNLQF
jgi:hypothetical protein